jgi:hypothetical protein
VIGNADADHFVHFRAAPPPCPASRPLDICRLPETHAQDLKEAAAVVEADCGVAVVHSSEQRSLWVIASESIAQSGLTRWSMRAVVTAAKGPVGMGVTLRADPPVWLMSGQSPVLGPWYDSSTCTFDPYYTELSHSVAPAVGTYGAVRQVERAAAVRSAFEAMGKPLQRIGIFHRPFRRSSPNMLKRAVRRLLFPVDIACSALPCSDARDPRDPRVSTAQCGPGGLAICSRRAWSCRRVTCS